MSGMMFGPLNLYPIKHPAFEIIRSIITVNTVMRVICHDVESELIIYGNNPNSMSQDR
jgi:hypothetical protein